MRICNLCYPAIVEAPYRLTFRVRRLNRTHDSELCVFHFAEVVMEYAEKRDDIAFVGKEDPLTPCELHNHKVPKKIETITTTEAL